MPSDAGFVPVCQEGEQLACGVSSIGECRLGIKVCRGGAWSGCLGAVLPAPEICDGKDNDCDGLTDDMGTLLCGVGACARTVQVCLDGNLQRCEPGAPSAEICNGLDDDCDGRTDEGFGTLTRGTGACQRSVPGCLSGALQSCDPAASDICDPNLQILLDSTDASHRGYTVVRVWGTHHEMGHAIGRTFAGEIEAGIASLRSFARFPAARTLVAQMTWPAEIEDEISGIADGIAEVLPNTTVDLADVKALNSYSDWGNATACRSHSCWGSFVEPPVKTLSTRRLDFDTPVDFVQHHVVYAVEPGDGSVRWVNFSWPGVVTVVTGLNAHGTLVSLHDYNSIRLSTPGLTFRSVAARRALTEPDADSLEGLRGQTEALLGGIAIATGGFINLFAPEGIGGVFTCPAGGGCGTARVPQDDYFGGEVLIASNAQTDGHTVPAGAEFIDAYYAQGGTKKIADHFGLMGTKGLHLVSVAYVGEEDMRFWFQGRGRVDHLELEWTDLIPVQPPSTDSGGL
jgi:hypothetical protein